MDNGLTPYQLAQLREALDQGGLGGGGKLAGGLVLGSRADGPGAGVGDVRISGSVRESMALGAGVYRDSFQMIPDRVFTPVEFSGARFDSDRCWDAGSPTRLTVRTGGVYVLYGFVTWTYNSTANSMRYLSIRLNGVRHIAMEGVGVAGFDAGLASGPHMNVAGVFWLNEGDYIELQVYQTVGEELDIRWAEGFLQPEFGMVRVA